MAPIFCVTVGALAPGVLMSCVTGGSVDVLMLQEHHLSDSRIRRCGSIMPRYHEVFWSAAFGPSGIRGGMSIADSWRTAIIDRGIVILGRAH